MVFVCSYLLGAWLFWNVIFFSLVVGMLGPTQYRHFVSTLLDYQNFGERRMHCRDRGGDVCMSGGDPYYCWDAGIILIVVFMYGRQNLILFPSQQLYIVHSMSNGQILGTSLLPYETIYRQHECLRRQARYNTFTGCASIGWRKSLDRCFPIL